MRPKPDEAPVTEGESTSGRIKCRDQPTEPDFGFCHAVDGVGKSVGLYVCDNRAILSAQR